MGKFICAGLLCTAMTASGCLQGSDNVEVDDVDLDSEDAVLGESEDALGFNKSLQARHSGKCLDIKSASNNNGAPLIQWNCHGGYNQKFHFLHVGGGDYNIIAAHSGKCLDVNGASTSNLADIIQWPCHGGNNQKFRPVYRSGGYYNLVAAHSGKCIDVRGASQSQGAEVIQYDCHSGYNQQFRPY